MVLPLALALLIGSALVTLGAGGSIVTMPVLIYAAGLDVHRAAGTSLVIVGLVAVAGAIAQWRSVEARMALPFAAAGMLATWPGVWLNHRSPAWLVLLGFGATALVVAARMAGVIGRGGRLGARDRQPRDRDGSGGLPALLLSGAAVGAMTGFFGVGGGFLVVPALSLLLGLGIIEAVATSLLVIALNSAAGLVGHLSYGSVDWGIAARLATAAILGAAMTLPLARRFAAATLQRAFAVVLVLIGTAMLAESAWEALA